MNEEQIKSLIEQLKAQGLTEDEIMDVFYQTFTEGKMDRKDLEVLTEAMGYELTDDFKEDSTPDPIASEGAEGISEASAEDLKEIKPGETPEEFEAKIDEAKEEGIGEEEKPEEPVAEEKGDEEEVKEEVEAEEKDVEADEDAGEDEESEDEEWEKAQKLFKI